METTTKLEAFLTEAKDLTEDWQIEQWQRKVRAYLFHTRGKGSVDKFDKHAEGWGETLDDFAGQVGYLEALSELEGAAKEREPIGNEAETSALSAARNRVFVVHGHDDHAKESVCRFIEKLGLQAVVLHEQPSEGLTIVEKFERHSAVAFAVVLLTPDDKGAAISSPDALQFRARQNVVLELGYFLGTLGRSRVCALHKGEVEIPSDYDGVVYLELDETGAWRAKLAQEFVHAKLEIDLSGIL